MNISHSIDKPKVTSIKGNCSCCPYWIKHKWQKQLTKKNKRKRMSWKLSKKKKQCFRHSGHEVFGRWKFMIITEISSQSSIQKYPHLLLVFPFFLFCSCPVPSSMIQTTIHSYKQHIKVIIATGLVERLDRRSNKK